MRPLIAASLLFLLAGCFSQYADSPEPGALVVRRAPYANDMVLSGELEAARGEFLTVPALPNWQTSIKWIAEDGAAIKANDPVAELDNTSLTADLDSKRQSETQAMQELQQREGEWEADLEQKQLDVEKKRSELDKAQIDARVPKDILSDREYEERQKTLRRTTTEHEKALDLLRSRRKAIEADRANLVLRIDKVRREIHRAEEGISTMVLRSPREGIVVLRDHPWEGRKLQMGDAVWVGFPIAMLPDLQTMRVTAMMSDVDDGKIAAGMPATVTLDAFPSMQFKGTISSISAVAQESRRQSLRRHFEVLVALDKLDQARMRPGLSARVVVHREKAGPALLAPRAAIDFTGKSPRARLASGKDVEISVRSCNAQDCVVTKGLTEGQQLKAIVEAKRG